MLLECLASGPRVARAAATVRRCLRVHQHPHNISSTHARGTRAAKHKQHAIFVRGRDIPRSLVDRTEVRPKYYDTKHRALRWPGACRSWQGALFFSLDGLARAGAGKELLRPCYSPCCSRESGMGDSERYPQGPGLARLLSLSAELAWKCLARALGHVPCSLVRMKCSPGRLV